MSYDACEIAYRPSPAAAPVRALAQQSAVLPPLHRDDAIDKRLRRKISSRLARLLPFEMRSLENAAPLVSFTFDDVPESAHSRGAAMLEQRGARGVYYVATALIGRRTAHWTLIDRDGVADLHRRGHEIGLHTHEHRAVGSFSAQEFRIDFEKNRAQLQDILPGIDPRNFAYPFGVPAFERKRQLSAFAHSSRGIQPGINAGAFDPHFLKCVELADARLTAQALDSYLDAVAAQKGWLVFLLHDVSSSPSPYGCSTGRLEHALDGVAARGIDIVTIAEALAQSRSSSALAALRARFAELS